MLKKKLKQVLIAFVHFCNNPWLKINSNYFLFFFGRFFQSNSYVSTKSAVRDKLKYFPIYSELFKIIDNEGIIIDCGAHIGYRSIILNIASHCEVHSFEPYSKNYFLLEKNTRSYKNIKIYNFGISNVNKKLMMGYPKNADQKNINSGNCSYIDAIDMNFQKLPSEKINLKNFFDVYQNYFINKKIEFIKIDVQGDEKNIFHSMSFLLNQNTSFEIEISHNYNFTIGDVKNIISDRHYSIFTRKETLHKSTKKDLFLIPSIYEKKILKSNLSLVNV